MARQYKTGLIITGDASGGIKAVRATEKELAQLNQRFEGGSRRARTFAQESGGVSRELQVLKRMAAPVGAALAGMFAANTLREQINFADQLQKTNLRIGASTEALSEYAHVANLADVQFNQLTTAWQRQSRRIAQAAQDTGEARDALAALNLDAGELARLAPEEQFERIAEAMSGVAGEAQRVAYAQKIWDSEGVKLLQIVNQGTDAIRAQREEAQRLGLTISQDTAEAMAGFNDEVTRLQAVGTGLSRQILSELVPAMTSGMQATSEWIDEMGGGAQILDTTKDVATGLAALLAGRYAGSLATATAAKLAATRQAVLYQAALARMAGVSATAAGAQTALAAATRAASGALALVGGPGGAAILAGAAIFAFRDELGMTLPKIDANTTAVNKLTGALDDMSRAEANLTLTRLVGQLAEVRAAAEGTSEALQEASRPDDGLGEGLGGGYLGISGREFSRQTQELREVGAAAGETQQKAVNLEAAIALVTDRLGELDREATSTEPTVTEVGDAAREAAKAAKEQADALEALRREMDPLRAEHAAYTDRLSVLNQALAEGTVGQQEYGEAVRWAAQQYVRAATGAEEYEKQQKSLVAQYDRHHQKAQQLREDLANINEMYRRGDIDGDTYSRMIANVRDEMRQLALDADPFAQDMSRAWEEASNRIDETFADAFAGAFDSFDDFADQLLDGFKRLLAELAYQAALRPIVVGFTADMQNMLGLGSGQGGGFSNTLSGINSVAGNIGKVTDFLGLTSSLGVAGTAPISYATGFGAQVATGTYTGALGSASAAASTSTSGVLSTLSSAAPWIAGGLALDSILDLGIVEGITDFVSDLFGGGKSEPSLHMRTVAPQDDYRGVFENTNHEVWGDSPFGTVGFWDPGTSRLNDLFGGDFDKARQMTEAIAAQDQMLAALADSEEQLAAMTEAAREFEHWGGDAQSILDGLGDRTVAIVSAIDDEWAAFAGGLEGDNQAVMERIQQTATTIELMSTAAERLNLNLGETGELSLTAADSLAQMAGGAQALAAAQQGYYQAMYSEAERLSWSYSELTQSLSEHVDAIPRSVEEYRNLVEGLDLSTESGRELYLTLTQLAPAFAESVQGIEQAITGAYQEHLGRAPEIEGFDYWVDRVQSGAVTLNEALEYIANSAEAAAGGMDATRMRIEIMRLEGREAAAVAEERRIELAYMEQSLHPLQQRIWALEDEAAAQAEAERRQQERNRALEQERQAMERAQQQLQTFSNRIDDWLAQLNATDRGMGTPQEQFASAQGDFAAMLVRAENGDRDALQSITQYADRYLSAAQGMYASGDAAQSVRNEIVAAMEGLPELLSAEQFLAQEIAASLGEQTDALAAELQALRDQAAGIVEANAGGSQLLVEILQHEMALLGETVLTDAQVRAALAPHATDAEIDRLIGRVDANGDGMVSLQEAANARLDSMAGGIASAMSPLFDQIDLDGNDLIDYREFERIFRGVATDDELRRIYSRLDMDGDRQISKMEAVRRAAASTASASEDAADNTGVRGALWDAIGSVEWEVRQIALRTINSSTGIRVSWARNHNHNAFADLGYRISREMRAQGIANGGTAYANGGAFVGGVQAFANGGAFTNSVVNSPTTFPMGLMGEAGPEAIMPLTRHGDGSLGVRAELPPLPPLLDGGDVVEVLQDLRREVAQLRRENAKLQGEGNKHAAASVRVQQAGFQRAIDAAERGNEHLDDMARAARLEAAR